MPSPAPADLIFHNGSVLSVDAENRVVPAVAVREGRVLALGPDADILALAGPDTEVVDLAGRALLPGFVEAHGHPVLTALGRGDPTVDVRALHVPDFAAVLGTIRRCLSRTPPGTFVLFFGLDAQLHAGMVEPTMAVLDALAPDHPIAIQSSNFHAMFLNRRALVHFGIDRDRADPPGGHIVRADDGTPTGKLVEKATRLVLDPYVASLGEDRTNAAVASWLWTFARAGYTTTSEHGVVPNHLPIIERQVMGRPEGVASPVRVVGYHVMLPDGTTAAPRGFGDERFTLVGVKLWADGSPFVGNIWVSEPYLSTEVTLRGMALPPNHRGAMNWKAEEIARLVDLYAAQGWQISVHVQGDRTFDAVLDAFEAAIARHGLVDHRFRIEHCAFAQPRHIDRAMALGVTFSFFLSHLWYWGEVLRDGLFGAERAGRYMPIGSAFRAGMRTSVHCDSPMTDPDPIRCIDLAVNRRTEKGAVIGPGETIPIEEAIRTVTINAAWQLRREDEIGSIEPGKRADFTLLDRNPLAVPPDDLRSLTVLGTWLDGRPVWGLPA